MKNFERELMKILFVPEMTAEQGGLRAAVHNICQSDNIDTIGELAQWCLKAACDYENNKIHPTRRVSSYSWSERSFLDDLRSISFALWATHLSHGDKEGGIIDEVNSAIEKSKIVFSDDFIRKIPADIFRTYIMECMAYFVLLRSLLYMINNGLNDGEVMKLLFKINPILAGTVEENWNLTLLIWYLERAAKSGTPLVVGCNSLV